jgi:hypothetical protein
VTAVDPIHLARTVIDKYGADADKPSVHLARALLDGAHERDALRAEVEQLRGRRDWPYEALHHDEHHEREDALRTEVDRVRPVYEMAVKIRYGAADWSALVDAVDAALAREPR